MITKIMRRGSSSCLYQLRGHDQNHIKVVMIQKSCESGHDKNNLKTVMIKILCQKSSSENLVKAVIIRNQLKADVIKNHLEKSRLKII